MTRLTFTRAHKDMWRLYRRAPRDPQTGCYVWQGHRLPAGYGTYNWPSGRGLVHRRSHELFVGPIPTGYEVDHRCRNTSCVNPDHLQAVTPAVNRQRQGAAVTHCPRGHEYTSANTYCAPSSPTCRRCRECTRTAPLRRKAGA